MQPDVEAELSRLCNEQYPGISSFNDWQNKEKTIEQRVLEFKLETLVRNCLTMLNEDTQKVKPGNSLKFRCPVVLPDLRRFNQEKDDSLRELSQVQYAEP
ncbi:MAG: hypothetical protein EZS28_027272, partial [Streblomastix strix]